MTEDPHTWGHPFASLLGAYAGTDGIWTSVHRWKGQHVRKLLMSIRCTADTGFLCS